ncbi:MAG TPA: cobalt ECF transporter T component CbiQ [Anaerolineae bacterium]|nr:cobalt ECF transporter T component CbiQ [Anaerolineae bacterium]HOQ98626.1 cobalt ECF transporter T component CbiQ [Anaerolineae bacterium]HPL27165.1 cobalt ECF transporter T component CbiQ [Anaerolineae bacterium]
MSRALERSLGEIGARLEQSLFAEEVSRRAGLLQSLDPRVKVVTTLALIVAANLARRAPAIAGLYLLALLLAWASAVPLGLFVRRVWLAVPLFTGLVALPALVLTPGPVLAQLPLGLAVTRTGAVTVLLLLLRVGTSVSLGLLLVLTTPWPALLRALTVLRVPDTLVLIVGMTYRYIYVLLRLANDMFLSRKSRVVSRLSAARERQMQGAIAGTLLARSLHTSGEVYLTMQSRGFRGYGQTLRPGRVTWRDCLWAAAVALVAALAVLVAR